MTTVTLLGTSCMVPTKERNVSSLYISHKGDGLLFDCGEGTQRQMNLAKLNRNDVKHIFLSHWHADHVAGTLGLIQTIANKERNVTLHIYGPTETKERMQHILSATIFDQALNIVIHEYSLIEEPHVLLETEDYYVYGISLSHGIPCMGFSFVEKDRRRIKVKEIEKLGIKPGPVLAQFQAGKNATVNGKVVKADDVTYIVRGKKCTYIPDTHFCQTAIDLAFGSDILICESTYTKQHEENAHKFNHLTSEQAGQIAAMSGSKRLVLTHLSQRYKNPADILDQAKDVFAETELGYDFMKINL